MHIKWPYIALSDLCMLIYRMATSLMKTILMILCAQNFIYIYIYIYIYIFISRKRTQRIFFNTRDWKTFCFSRLLLVLEKFVSRHMNGRECSEVQQEGSPQTGGTRFWGKLPRCFCLGGESTCTTEFDVPGGITPLDKDQRKVRQLMSEMS